MSVILPSTFTSSVYFESIFQNSKQNVLLFMNADGMVTGMNNSFTSNFGYMPEELIGKSAKILFTKTDIEKGRFDKEIAEVMETGQGQDNNYLVGKNGELTWVSGESIRVTNDEGEIGLVKMIQNIHQQKTSEESANLQHDINERILSSIEDAVFVINDQMEIISANRAFTNLFQINKEKMNFATLIKQHDIDEGLLNKVRDCILSRETIIHNEIEIQTNTGEKKAFHITCKAIVGDGSKNNVLIAAHDISLQKQVLREREDIIGFIAHELRNPLANIGLCNELLTQLIEENNTADSIAMLNRSKNNVLRLNKMIGELYDATRVSSGNIRLELTDFNFDEMIKEAVETIQSLQPDYKIIVNGSANIMVHGDRYRLIQVITNYLSNGIKYSSDNNTVNLSVHFDEQKITVSVIDNGLGIPKNQLPFIFERFFRAEKTKNLEGIGLGLYLCRQIITAHHGQVWAESEEGAGSAFYFSIPLRQS